MSDAQDLTHGLMQLADSLAQRRDHILRTWHARSAQDPELTTANNLPRSQFNDHIPEVLDAFEQELKTLTLALNSAGKRDVEPTGKQQKESAAGHGLHRWQQGYRLKELMREWGHLQMCLVEELEVFAANHTGFHADVMPAARRVLARLCSDGVCESAGQYSRLQRMEASSRVRDLEGALEQLEEMGRQRAEAWREAAHDLRGNLGVVKNATSVLSIDGVPDTMRSEAFTLLQRGVGTLHNLLNDLMILARLEAGHDRRKIQSLDVARLLIELCENMRPLAISRELYLDCDGPAPLTIDGDAIKIQRIAHNLVLNAIKYTEKGGVRVSWGLVTGEKKRWNLCVQDTGPGFQSESVTAFAKAIKVATQEAHAVEEKTSEEALAPPPPEPAETLPSQSYDRPRQQPPGEGIGLSIVKRLCELLDASLELETAPGQGTTFRVLLPSIYEEQC